MSGDLKGMLGSKAISQMRFSAVGPMDAGALGNRSAIPLDMSGGVKFCCTAWLKKLANSGVTPEPMSISQPSFLKLEIWAV